MKRESTLSEPSQESAMTNRELRENVENVILWRVPGVAGRIQVSVSDGRVRLKGCVRTWNERDEARRAVWSAPGILAVEDWLKVAPEEGVPACFSTNVRL
jgi:osmotically-inducible protein OsmY